MISHGFVLLGLLGLAVSFPDWNSGSFQTPYNGPPAPLNQDGTVAFTKEVIYANAAHKAAVAQELQRLQSPHGPATAHLGYTSQGYNQIYYGPQNHHREDGQYREGQYNSHYDDGQYRPHHHQGTQYISRQFDDGQYKPHHHYPGQHNSKQFDNGQYKSYHHYGGRQNIKQFDDGQYKPHHHGRGHYHRNPAAQVPAELNADGTVAHTPEYKAVASSFLAAYKQALTRHRRSAERYQGPPAPLNIDGTVDFTPEIKNANAAHRRAFSNHNQRLQEAANLAASNPDLTSPPSPDYNPRDNGQYNPLQQDDVLYKSQVFDDGLFEANLYDDELYGFPPEDEDESDLHFNGAEFSF